MKHLKVSLEKRSEQRERIATRVVAALLGISNPLLPSAIIRKAVDLATTLVDKLEVADAKDFEELYK